MPDSKCNQSVIQQKKDKNLTSCMNPSCQHLCKPTPFLKSRNKPIGHRYCRRLGKAIDILNGDFDSNTSTDKGSTPVTKIVRSDLTAVLLNGIVC